MRGVILFMDKSFGSNAPNTSFLQLKLRTSGFDGFNPDKILEI